MKTVDDTQNSSDPLAHKIARLVEERGWNQEVFARISQLNRHTVRQILNSGPKRKLRNATVSQCAEALGLTVHELRTMPIERLLPRMHGKPAVDEEAIKRLHSQAELPQLVSWIGQNTDRAEQLSNEEISELLEMQIPGGPLERFGVEPMILLIERRRKLLCQVRVIAGTEHIDLLEGFLDLLFEKASQKLSTQT